MTRRFGALIQRIIQFSTLTSALVAMSLLPVTAATAQVIERGVQGGVVGAIIGGIVGGGRGIADMLETGNTPDFDVGWRRDGAGAGKYGEAQAGRSRGNRGISEITAAAPRRSAAKEQGDRQERGRRWRASRRRRCLGARSVPLLALCKGKAPSPAPASGVSSSRYALEAAMVRRSPMRV